MGEDIQSIAVRVPKSLESAYVQEGVAALLYHVGNLSMKEARELIGKSRREFEEEVLPRYGFTTMEDTLEDLDRELTA